MIGLLVPAVLVGVLALVWPARSDVAQRLEVRWWPAALGAFAVELVLYNPPIDQHQWAMQIGPWIWVATRFVMLAVALHNARAGARLVPAWLLAAAGLALNTLVIGANNGYMPQSTEAALQAWGAERVHAFRAYPGLHNVAPLDADTRLAWLGDVIAQPTWLPRPNVISVGDLLLSLGIAGWMYGALGAPGPRLARVNAIVGLIGSPIHAPVRGTAPAQTSAAPAASQHDATVWP
jgi:hypothetical protein